MYGVVVVLVGEAGDECLLVTRGGRDSRLIKFRFGVCAFWRVFVVILVRKLRSTRFGLLESQQLHHMIASERLSFTCDGQ